MTEERPLPGGTVTPIVRAGDTVRRAGGAARAPVHDLLRHLAAVGFDGAPRFLGLDERGREILSFIDGEVTAFGAPEGMFSDAALAGAAALLRRFHDSTVDFAAARPDGWRFQVGAPRSGPVICHNDLGPYNTVYRGGLPVAFIDWDFAAPAPRGWDVAYALWRYVPLYDDAQCARLGWPVRPRGPRIRLFLDAYGLSGAGMLDVVRRRQEVTRATIEAWAAAGDEAFVDLLEEGRLNEIDANLSYLARSASGWASFLD